MASDSLKQPQRPDLEVYVAALEKAVAEAEVRSERWRQEADAAVNASRPWKPMLPRCRKPSPRPKP